MLVLMRLPALNSLIVNVKHLLWFTELYPQYLKIEKRSCLKLTGWPSMRNKTIMLSVVVWHKILCELFVLSYISDLFYRCLKIIAWIFFSCIGIKLTEFIPSLESLFEAEELRNAGLAENRQFQFLLKSGYEHITRASSFTS